MVIHLKAYHHLQITWLSYFGSENQSLPLRSWFVTCRHIPIATSLAVPSSCVVTQTPMGTNSGTRRRKCKFPLLFVNCDRGRIEIDHLYGLRCRGWYCNPKSTRCAGRRGHATAGTTRAVPDCSNNHSSADRIVVNSYNQHLIAHRRPTGAQWRATNGPMVCVILDFFCTDSFL